MVYKEIIMYSDGGSRGNPGDAALGVYIKTLEKKYGHYIGKTTNNIAEYSAVVFGLEKIIKLVGKINAKKIIVRCHLDSELIVRQLNHEYKVKDEGMQKMFITVWNLMLDFKKVEFTHVRREKNTVADAMVNKAIDDFLHEG